MEFQASAFENSVDFEREKLLKIKIYLIPPPVKNRITFTIFKFLKMKEIASNTKPNRIQKTEEKTENYGKYF